LIDAQESPEQLESLAQSLIAGGADAIQLRDKNLSDRELIQRARLLRRMTRDSETLLIVNDRPDIAALAGADGVHVGQDELSVKDARSILGPKCLVGVSTHTIEQARTAVLDGANYIGCGPTFPSQTKQFDEFPGIEFLQQVAAEIRLPAFAIGGVSQKNLAEVRAAGFSRVAVSAAVTGQGDPVDAARELVAALA
jgi:thiamine-phosphate pyrophosphorylase